MSTRKKTDPYATLRAHLDGKSPRQRARFLAALRRAGREMSEAARIKTAFHERVDAAFAAVGPARTCQILAATEREGRARLRG